MRRRRVVIGIVVVVILVAIVAGIALQARVAPAVETAVVEREQIGIVVTASGTVRGESGGAVYPAFASTLDEVFVKDGEPVKRGQVIAVLDDAPLEAKVDQAQAAVAAARAGLAAANAQFPDAADRRAASSAVASARQSFLAAKKAWEALKADFDVTPIAFRDPLRPALQQAVAARDAAYTGWLQAKAAATKLSSTGAAQAQRGSALAQLDQSTSALSDAREARGDIELVAPTDGVVVFNAVGAPGSDGTTPKAEAGVPVSPATAPFSVVKPGEVVFVAEVDETDVERVQPGMVTSILLDAYPNEEFSARVDRVKPVATTTSTGGKAYEVFIVFEGSENSPRIGMQGSAEISVSDIDSALVIPIEALFEADGEQFVYRVDAGVLKRIVIEIGTVTETQVEIVSGLDEGAVVALSGEIDLRDDLPVQGRE